MEYERVSLPQNGMSGLDKVKVEYLHGDDVEMKQMGQRKRMGETNINIYIGRKWIEWMRKDGMGKGEE